MTPALAMDTWDLAPACPLLTRKLETMGRTGPGTGSGQGSRKALHDGQRKAILSSSLTAL
jgi:hypothetical protein